MKKSVFIPSALLKRVVMVAAACTLVGCAVPKEPFDYSAFREAKPRSILVMPPVNSSPDVQAGYSMLSHVTLPLSEAGYYVLPVAVVAKSAGPSSACCSWVLPLLVAACCSCTEP